MPEKVLQQIKYLCREIPKVEWSGILFYKVEGSIKDPENMKIILEEILPMHKGTSTYTEYTFDERVVEHMMDNEHLEDCKIGHIHSHNTMGVFFSGTDWDELEDNAPNHNMYLSLIVNNFMDFCAKVAFIAEPNNLSARDEEGSPYSITLEGVSSGKKLLTYDCTIISPCEGITVEDNFSKKVTAIIEDAAKRVVPVKSFPSITPPFNPNYGMGNRSSTTFEDDWMDWEYPTKPKNDISEDEVEDIIDSSIEDFSVYVLNIEGTTRVFHNITDVVKYHKSKFIDGRILAKGVLNSYFESYSKYYEGADEMKSGEMYERVAEQVIDNLEDERDSSTLPYMEDMLNPTIEGLKSMLKHFKNK